MRPRHDTQSHACSIFTKRSDGLRKPYAILVADSSLAIRTLISEVLTDEHHTVFCCQQQWVTADAIEHLRPDLLILELHHINSAEIFQLLDQLRRRSTTQAIPMLATSTDTPLLNRLAYPLRQFNCATLGKPFDLDQLIASVAQALKPQVHAESRPLRATTAIHTDPTGYSAPPAT
jgi:DNA-binding response OmpR family regulator